MAGIKIRDNETGEIFEYGENNHHALRISPNGGCLTFENMQNGDGSLPDGRGGYSFVLEDGKTPNESESLDAIQGASYANVGGFEPESLERIKEEKEKALMERKDWKWRTEMTTLKKINVKDVTTYSQNDKERKPRIIELEVCGIKFKVHRYLHIPGTWFLTCQELSIEKEDMKTDDLKKAIHNARAFMVGYLDAMITQMCDASKILQESWERCIPDRAGGNGSTGGGET